MYLFDRLFKRMIRDGEMRVTDHRGTVHTYGKPSVTIAPAAFRLTDDASSRAIAITPVLGAAEAYMDGKLLLEQGDILDLLRLVTYNVRWDRDNPVRYRLWRQARVAGFVGQFNQERRARRNVAHHYDLSDRLYDLFLDVDRQYSCAYYTDPANSLDRAQGDKLAHIAAKLDLQPGQRVLDIGCGWGGMALYLHRVAGVEVLGVTLSEEQLKVARARAAEAGVSGHVKFELIDYRALTGQFDRIVSVGMFEHVGLPHYRQYFDQVHALLKPDGVALIHSIARADGPGATDPFITKYIFPGGYSPALSQIVPNIERAWLWITDIEVLRLHYAFTLHEWYARTVAARAEIEALYDARFWRMWTYYLAGAICAFENDGHMNVQIQLTKRRDALPLTRDYMMAAAARYREVGPSTSPKPSPEGSGER